MSGVGSSKDAGNEDSGAGASCDQDGKVIQLTEDDPMLNCASDSIFTDDELMRCQEIATVPQSKGFFMDELQFMSDDGDTEKPK